MSRTIRHPLSKYLPKKPEGPMRSPARALGWFSIGLGFAELAIPGVLARVAGMPSRPALMRAYGLREIGVGIGLLLSRNPQPWLWGRVAGDTLDIATVGIGPLLGGRRPLRTLTSVVVLAGIAAIDASCAKAAKPKVRQMSSHDYRGRSGFPKPAAEMRGAATKPLGA